MEQLVGFTVEGLRRHGWREVWVTLGTFPSHKEAEQAAARSTPSSAPTLATRIVPYYRVRPAISQVSVAQRPVAVPHRRAPRVMQLDA